MNRKSIIKALKNFDTKFGTWKSMNPTKHSVREFFRKTLESMVKKPMKPGMGSQKGSKFERDIARDLSLWWSDGKERNLFWRTHASGSFGTNAKIKAEVGDLMAIEDGGRDFMKVFNVECRHGKVIRVKDLVYDGQDKVGMKQFIKEGLTNAAASDRLSLWIFREQNMPTMAMMSEFDLSRLTNFPFETVMALCRGRFPMYNVAVFLYEDWKNLIEIKLIKKYAESPFALKIGK